MESNSAANCVLCNEETSQLLHLQAPELDICQRGMVNVKGKGEMNTFWVRRGSNFIRPGYIIRQDQNGSSERSGDWEQRVRSYTTSIRSREQGQSNAGTTSWGSFGLTSGEGPSIKNMFKK